MPRLTSIFPDILFVRVTIPSSPTIESPVLVSEINQKSVPFTEATETEVWTIKFFVSLTCARTDPFVKLLSC